MCLLFVSYRTTPGYRLVVAANRDEFLDRPTAPLGFLDREKTILGGRDLRGGGTWLGITAGQRFAAITNYRDPAANRAEAPSRGEILMEYLGGDTGAGEYLKALATRASRYNGFNLILGDALSLFYYSNQLPRPKLLSPGFYGLANHLLDTPWPKVVRGKELLHGPMVETEHVNPPAIVRVLTDSHRPPDHQLPQTGVGLDWERLLATIFIDGQGYGTRSSAVITVTDGGGIEFTEKTWQKTAGGETPTGLVRMTFNV